MRAGRGVEELAARIGVHPHGRAKLPPQQASQAEEPSRTRASQLVHAHGTEVQASSRRGRGGWAPPKAESLSRSHAEVRTSFSTRRVKTPAR